MRHQMEGKLCVKIEFWVDVVSAQEKMSPCCRFCRLLMMLMQNAQRRQGCICILMILFQQSHQEVKRADLKLIIHTLFLQRMISGERRRLCPGATSSCDIHYTFAHRARQSVGPLAPLDLQALTSPPGVLSGSSGVPGYGDKHTYGIPSDGAVKPAGFECCWQSRWQPSQAVPWTIAAGSLLLLRRMPR